jgi:hypothetical protein
MATPIDVSATPRRSNSGPASPLGYVLRNRRLTIVVITCFVIIVVAAFLWIHYWPFSQNSVRASLNEILPANLTIEHFSTTYFPHPGCVAKGISFDEPGAAPGASHLVTIQRVTIQSNYWDLIVRPHHIYRVIADGLQIHIPEIGSDGGAKFSFGSTTSNMTIGEIVANGTVLEIARHDDRALKFEIHELRLGSVSAQSAMSYHITMKNPEPPGEIQSTGKFGPWQSGDSGRTPVSGSFTFNQADLSVFNGIAGTLSSQGQFSGILNHIAIQASVDVPDFTVTSSGHPVHLATKLTSLVNGTNGDVQLQNVDASFMHTAVSATSDIQAKTGMPKKFTTVDLSVTNGHIDDVLWLFVTSKHSPMAGVTSLKAHVTIPPEGRPFLQEFRLVGDFGVEGGQFRPKTQDKVDKLSESARGEKNAENSPPSGEDVISDLAGHVEVHSGIATFSALSFELPGATAQLHGTYNLLNQKIDFHGTLKMDAKLPQTFTGVKSFFAKALAPFFDKKKGSVVPVEMDGTYSQPHFGLDLDPVHK